MQHELLSISHVYLSVKVVWLEMSVVDCLPNIEWCIPQYLMTKLMNIFLPYIYIHKLSIMLNIQLLKNSQLGSPKSNMSTLKPSNKGHIGDKPFVFCTEVVHFLEVFV